MGPRLQAGKIPAWLDEWRTATPESKSGRVDHSGKNVRKPHLDSYHLPKEI
jgi:hypothetical protein